MFELQTSQSLFSLVIFQRKILTGSFEFAFIFGRLYTYSRRFQYLVGDVSRRRDPTFGIERNIWNAGR